MKSMILVENAAGMRTLETTFVGALKHYGLNVNKYRRSEFPTDIEGYTFERIDTTGVLKSTDLIKVLVGSHLDKNVKTLSGFAVIGCVVEYINKTKRFQVTFEVDCSEDADIEIQDISKIINKLNSEIGSKLKVNSKHSLQYSEGNGAYINYFLSK